MNKKRIEDAKDADMAKSLQALQRAAQRARSLAVQTGTDLIVQRGAKVEHLSMENYDGKQHTIQARG